MTTDVAYTFFEATPSSEETTAFAELAASAGGELFRTFFGPRAATFLKRFYPHDDNYMGYPFSHFVRVDGEIAGLLCAFSCAQKESVKRSNHIRLLLQGATFLPRLIWFATRFSGIVDTLEHLEAGEFYIEFLAVSPKFQRKGLSRVLLDHAAEIARKQDQRVVVLDVDVENTPAIRAYEAWGMQITRSSPTYSYMGRTMGVHRMSRTL